jgi:hypothetical protein
VPTKRRKIPPRRINEPVPEWAQLLLAGEQPDRRDPEVEVGLFAWLIGDPVAGLPDHDTIEAEQLIARAGGWPEPAQVKG